ncbi:MAG TPA: potassium-transporting ATPase subunit B, partial [Acidimicrobiales bacterium]
MTAVQHVEQPDPHDRNSADHPEPSLKKESKGLFDPDILKVAVVDSFKKLDPRLMAKNPVMFVVEVGSVLTTFLFFRDLGKSTASE